MVQFGSSVIFLFTRKLVRSNLIHDNIEEFGCAGLSTALSLNGLVLYLPIIATSALAMTFLYGDIVYHINNTMKAAWGLLLFGGVHCIWSLFCVKIVKVLVLLINSFQHMFDSFLPIISVACLPLAYVLCTFGYNSWWYFFGACSCFGFIESSISYEVSLIIYFLDEQNFYS